MAELALHLQVQTQSCHDEIGRIGAELKAILPRCAADVSRLSVGIGNIKVDAKNLLEAHLQSSLSHVHDSEKDSTEAGSSEEGAGNTMDNAASDHDAEKESKPLEKSSKASNDNGAMTPLETLETLSTLHALQQNLTTTKIVLTAASTYNHTLQKIPSLLTPTTLNQGVQALLDLENGARALRGMPGKSQRNKEIGEIRNQILTLLKPVLLHALNKVESRLGPLQTCVGMYQNLNKIESLMEEYVKSRPAAVHKLWFDFRKSKNGGGASGTLRGLDGLASESAEGGSGDDLEFYSDYDKGDKGEEGYGKMSNGADYGKATDADRSEPANDHGKAFGDWLPTWYEVVLVLFSEERRRADAIFGTDLAPEIMVKVLNECFRPIRSSFKTRLEAICPVDGVLHGNEQSFENICRAYESTLQFLSVAYEQIVDFESNSSTGVSSDDHAQRQGADGADIESDVPSRTKTPVQLHVMARSIFISVASPFAPYQICFSKLEANHSGMAARMVSSDIHNAVGGRILALSNMQESVERLAGLAPFMFPLAQGGYMVLMSTRRLCVLLFLLCLTGKCIPWSVFITGAIVRFESLNSGFWAIEGLNVIDIVLSKHIDELSIAFHTLSTNVLSDDNKLSEIFDEQQVQCALEILRIAGVVKRHLLSFEENTKDRLRGLADRMGATIDQETALIEALGQRTTSTDLVPNSLSAVDIEAIIATSVCGGEGDRDSSMKSPSVLALQRLSESGQNRGSQDLLFPRSAGSLERLVKCCQAFVFDISSDIPIKHLQDMSLLSIWGQEESMWSTATSDSYGTLPQTYITQVGEHMLALVQALEPFASDKDGLQFANSVMDGIEHVSAKSWRKFVHAINADSDDLEFVSIIRKGHVLKDFVLTDNGFEDDEDDDDIDSAAQMFCNQWLDVVCSAVTGLMLEQIMRVQKLTRKGCEHLSVDCNYIVNVLTALGVSGHPHPLLMHIAELAKMSSEDLQTRIIESTDDKYGIRSTETRIALMRGIPIN